VDDRWLVISNRTVVVASDTMISDADPSYGSTTLRTDQTTSSRRSWTKPPDRAFALLQQRRILGVAHPARHIPTPNYHVFRLRVFSPNFKYPT